MTPKRQALNLSVIFSCFGLESKVQACINVYILRIILLIFVLVNKFPTIVQSCLNILDVKAFYV